MISFRKLTTATLCAGLILTGSIAAEAYNDNLSLVINEKEISIPSNDQPPVIKANRVYVPLRIISENLGSQVNWLPETKQVVIVTDKKYNQVPKQDNPEKIQIVIDEKPLEIPLSYGAPFLTDNGRTMVPLRIIGESLGCQVEWLGSERTVAIKSKQQSISDDDVSYIPTPGDSPKKPEPVLTNDELNLINKLANYKTNIRLSDGTKINTEQLLTMSPDKFTSKEISHLRSIEKLLDQYDAVITLPNGGKIVTAELTIFGSPMASARQLNAWIDSVTPRIKAKMENEYGREFIPIPRELAELYIEIGNKYGIRGDLAFAQAAKETHYFQFTGSVKPNQNNYCGLWAIGSPNTGNEPLNGADPESVWFENGVHGAIFETPAIGVEAHIQHLYAYATTKPLPAGTVLYDPRYIYAPKGSAPTWMGLNANWAVPGTTYGQSIIQDYWLYALKY